MLNYKRFRLQFQNTNPGPLEYHPKEYYPVLIAAYYLRHNIPDTALDHLLQLIQIDAAHDIKELGSLYHFKKKYKKVINCQLRKLYPCLVCDKLFVNNDAGMPSKGNQPCGHEFSKETNKGALTFKFKQLIIMIHN